MARVSEMGKRVVRTVRMRNISDQVTEREAIQWRRGGWPTSNSKIPMLSRLHFSFRVCRKEKDYLTDVLDRKKSLNRLLLRRPAMTTPSWHWTKKIFSCRECK